MEFYAITDHTGSARRIFAVDPAGRHEWRLDGGLWVELDGSPVLLWLLDGRVDLDRYLPARNELPPVPTWAVSSA